MKRIAFTAMAALIAFGPANAAFAASDYFLKIEGVTGEAAVAAAIESWSWGVSNAGSLPQRDPASSQTTGQRLRESPTRLSTGRGRVAAGDVNGDGRADIVAASTVPEVQRFTLVVDATSPAVRQYCVAGQHIPRATVTMNQAVVLEMEDVLVSSCSTAPGTGPRQAIATASTRTRCVDAACSSVGTATLTLTGRMKDPKTGHVTLLK